MSLIHDGCLPQPDRLQLTLDHFMAFSFRIFKSHEWPISSAPSQAHLTTLLAAWIKEEQTTLEDNTVFQMCLTFQDFTGGKTYLTHPTEFALFGLLLCRFCVLHHIDGTIPLTTSESSFLALSLQGKSIQPEWHVQSLKKLS